MTESIIIWLIVGTILVVALGFSVRAWISIYNKFQYWINRAKKKFADVDVIMQERLDNIHALAQIAKSTISMNIKPLRMLLKPEVDIFSIRLLIFSEIRMKTSAKRLKLKEISGTI